MSFEYFHLTPIDANDLLWFNPKIISLYKIKEIDLLGEVKRRKEKKTKWEKNRNVTIVKEGPFEI